MKFAGYLGHAAIAPSNKNPLEYMKNNTNMIFQSSPVTEKEVENIILHLKDSSSGWDELRPNVMKTIKRSILFPLMYASNLSFQTGVFPRELKIANVVPIFKSGDEMVFTNTDPCQSCIYSQKYWNDLCIIDWSITLMKTSYYININLDSRKANPLTWPYWRWSTRYLKL